MAEANYDPDGPGLDNGNFLGLPEVDEPRIRFVAIPYDATVSYGTGTAGGPANVLAASRQLDVCVPGVERPWNLGFAWGELDCASLRRSGELRAAGQRAVRAAEEGRPAAPEDLRALAAAGRELAGELSRSVERAHAQNQLPVVVGGEHAVALGAYRACGLGGDFGILQLDAHMDLRHSYEGLEFSHASVMHNALASSSLRALVQVGTRDYSPGEAARARREGARVVTFLDDELHAHKLAGRPFVDLAERIVAALPERVWVSLDVDGLDPSLCRHTGTPVPGGLSFAEADSLLARLASSGKAVLGMDLVEVAGAPHEYEGAVAGRLAYRFAVRVVAHRSGD